MIERYSSLRSEYDILKNRYESESSNSASSLIDVNEELTNEDLRMQIARLMEENKQLKLENEQLKGGRKF